MRTNEEMFQELDEFIESLNYDKTELIAILHRAQHIFGYLPMVVQSHIAKKLKINVSKVYGVVTFYSYFRMEPKGQYVISVCLGTACFVRGSGKILEKIEEILKIKILRLVCRKDWPMKKLQIVLLVLAAVFFVLQPYFFKK